MKRVLLFTLVCMFILTAGVISASEKGCRYLYDKGDKKAYIECLKINCDKGIVRACGDLGLTYNITEFGFDKTKGNEGINLLNSACEQEDAFSCLMLSTLYIAPKSRYYNPTKSMSFAKKGCDLGLDKSCRYVITLALENRKSDTSVIQTQYEKDVLNIAQKMSSKNIKFSTYHYRLGMLYLHGKTIEHDTTKALEAFMKGCDLQEDLSCFQMAQIYSEGKLVNKNLESADQFNKRGNNAKLAYEEERKNTPKMHFLSRYFY